MTIVFPLAHTHGRDEVLKDLLKTIQISICMKRKDVNYFTIRKLIIIHLTLPIYNAKFMQFLLEAYADNKDQLKGNNPHVISDLSVWNLNI